MPDPYPATADAIRVLVVDADDRVRESLSGLLAIGDHVKVVGSAGQAASALELVADCRPDVVIVDPRLPEVAGGISLIASLRELHPNIGVLVLCRSDAPDPALRDCGADGFLRKTFRPSELTAAIVAANRDGATPT
ncbi:MAG: response regulator [Candidatus Limnocylindrales bacterium]